MGTQLMKLFISKIAFCVLRVMSHSGCNGQYQKNFDLLAGIIILNRYLQVLIILNNNNNHNNNSYIYNVPFPWQKGTVQ